MGNVSEGPAAGDERETTEARACACGRIDYSAVEELAAFARGQIEELYAGSESVAADIAGGPSASVQATLARMQRHLACALIGMRGLEDNIPGFRRPSDRAGD